jgi:hypothetical protein
MQKNSSYPIRYVISLIFTGLGIGWLIGLSISPVVSIVITSITGSAAAIVAAMSGLEQRPPANNKDDDNDDKNTQIHPRRWRASPIPIAWLIVGIVAGSAIGIYVRNQDLLGGSDLTIEIKRWTDIGLNEEEVARRLFESRYSYRGWSGTDLSGEVEKWLNAGLTNKEEVARRLFESTYPLGAAPAVNTGETKEAKPTSTVLFTVSTTQCDTLYKALARSNEKLVEELGRMEHLRNLPDITNDPQALERIITEVICPLE